MNRTPLSFLLAVFLTLAAAVQPQTAPPDLNLGFEKVSEAGKLPDNWTTMGSGYSLNVDAVEKKSGQNSLRIEPVPAGGGGFGAAA